MLCKILYGNSRDIIRGNKTSDTNSKDRTNKRYDNTERYRTATRDTKKRDTSFYANKRIIGISTIIQELENNYLNENAIWSYYARDQLMIYSNSRELRREDMDEPEERPTTRALKTGFISKELLTKYCKLIRHKYPDHICTKCNGEDNIIPDVQLE
ncbi:hypothetical protein H5410_027869 [Solanum commersonii]|uniref:Uncharacterized protein n=1 Tax=Solanum commersonii TaxID=4109 RepID=A0A9J5Z0D8_SOLCO|nr:hypothetical protein H5410_027869 [Solanum commersonii]